MFSAWFSEIFLLCFRQHKPGIIVGRQRAPPNDDRKRKNSLTVNQNMAVGERWEIRSLLDLLRRDIMYYEYFNIWLTLTCQSKDSSNVSFMTNGYGIQNLYSHFICMILLSQPGGKHCFCTTSPTRTYFYLLFLLSFPSSFR